MKGLYHSFKPHLGFILAEAANRFEDLRKTTKRLSMKDSFCPRTLIATQTSRKIIFRTPDKAERGEDKGWSLVETRNALDGVLKIILREWSLT